jgi:uncharacterized protein (TIGR04168 family)
VTASSGNPPELAIIGDLHSAWNEDDVAYFNAADYPMLLFTGDLGGGLTRDGVAIARSLSALRRPALVMLGNNDVPEYAALSAELTYQRGVADLMGDEAAAPFAPVRTCGFSAHALSLGGFEVTLIAGRPFAMGGNELSFPTALHDSYGVSSLAQSRERLCALVDGCETEHLLFLAHNGPSGLGDTPDDPWGRDFGGLTGDWGDDDLADAVAHARARGRQPLAVIAGHMHWSRARPRRWQVHRDGTLYVNAARVPRVFETEGVRRRQHLALTLSPTATRVRTVEVPASRAAVE